MDTLRLSLVQSIIAWEDKAANLMHYRQLIAPLKDASDIIVLPEMFSTGFSMNASHLAETNDGETIRTILEWSRETQAAICGSFLAKDRQNDLLYNRGFFVTPEGESFFYDKRHLFRMGEEHRIFSPGTDYTIIPYRGWNIRMIICYDLRFPVWARNRNNEYDLLICSANWPAARARVWQTLLAARAIENVAYVCGVNRIGDDGNGIRHRGDSELLNFKGESLISLPSDHEGVVTHTINKSALEYFRQKFPAWKDADPFDLR